jgi:hypothetical protein
LSNRGWQDGGMTFKKTGVSEWRSGAGELTAKEHNGCLPLKSHGRCGKRPYRALGGFVRSGRRWADLGKGGRMVGIRTGFSQLFPDDSMQVVDFPHLAHVRLFWEQGFYGRDAETQGRELTVNHANHAKPENEHRMDADFGQNGHNGRNACPTSRVCVLVAIIGPNRAAKCA